MVLMFTTAIAFPVPEPVEEFVNEGVKKIEWMVRDAEANAIGAVPQASGYTTIGNISSGGAYVDSMSVDKAKLFATYVKAIYLNNVAPLLLQSIPFAVFVLYPFVVVANGWALRMIAERYLRIPVAQAVLMVLLAPHTWLEIFSYSIAVFEACYISTKALRKNLTWRDVRLYATNIALALILLFAAAVVESLFIIFLR